MLDTSGQKLSPGLASKGLFKDLDVGDVRFLASGFEEGDDGLDFGPHTTTGEDSGLLEFFHFSKTEATDILLVRLLIVEFDTVDISEDHEFDLEVLASFLGKWLSGSI